MLGESRQPGLENECSKFQQNAWINLFQKQRQKGIESVIRGVKKQSRTFLNLRFLFILSGNID